MFMERAAAEAIGRRRVAGETCSHRERERWEGEGLGGSVRGEGGLGGGVLERESSASRLVWPEAREAGGLNRRARVYAWRKGRRRRAAP